MEPVANVENLALKEPKGILDFVEHPLTLAALFALGGLVGTLIYTPFYTLCAICLLLGLHRSGYVSGRTVRVQVGIYVFAAVVLCICGYFLYGLLDAAVQRVQDNFAKRVAVVVRKENPLPINPEPPRPTPVPTPPKKVVTSKPTKKPPVGCPTKVSEEAFNQIKRLLAFKKKYELEVQDLAQKKSDAEHSAPTERIKGIEMAYQEKIGRLWRTYYRPVYIKEYRQSVENARDSIVEAGVSYRSFEDPTVPYDNPSGPDDLVKIAKELEKLANACSLGSPGIY